MNIANIDNMSINILKYDNKNYYNMLKNDSKILLYQPVILTINKTQVTLKYKFNKINY